MVIEWTSILFVVILLVVALVTIRFIGSKTNLQAEVKRKLFHVTMGLVMLLFPYLFHSIYSVGILGIMAVVILFILKNTKLKDSLGAVLYSVNRESLGELFFVISVFLIFYLSKGDQILYSIPILILTFADSTAALVGKSYGKKNLAQSNEDAKSIEGSFMFFMVAFMSTLVPLLLFTSVGREETLIISTIIGFNVALIEMISHTGNDNLLIPLTTYAFLATLIQADVEVLRQNLIIIGCIFLFVMVVNKIKVLSKLALVEILVVGYLVVVLYGIYAIIPPLMLFLTCMRLPRLGDNEKNNLYDSRIIETNVIVGIAICGLVAISGLREELFMIYVTCFAMHLAINTFVRLKYYFNLSEADSLVFSYLKGFFFIFLPGIILQKIVFNSKLNFNMLFFMSIILMLSCILILIKKRRVKEEEISIKNGYMHMKIVGCLTGIVGMVQYLKLI